MRIPLFGSGALMLACTCAALAAPVREIEITPDPPSPGEQVFTIRIKPGETRTYDKMTFECGYRQEFVSQTTDAQGAKVVNEPAAFTYRRKEVKLVDDLDFYVSFKVPMGLAKLSDMFGQTTFNSNSPISVAHITITAFTAQGKAWVHDLESKGLHKFEADDPAAPATAP